MLFQGPIRNGISFRESIGGMSFAVEAGFETVVQEPFVPTGVVVELMSCIEIGGGGDSLPSTIKETSETTLNARIYGLGRVRKFFFVL